MAQQEDMMARFRNVPGSGYGNTFIDSLIWGGRVWDMSAGPIKIWAIDPPTTPYDPDQIAEVIANRNFDQGFLEDVPDYSYVAPWTANEINALAYAAYDQYAAVCGLKFQPATSARDADLVWWKVDLSPIAEGVAGIHETPASLNLDGEYRNQLWGLFNHTAASWPYIQPGGDALNTMIHEMGHALGLAHPHDGGSEPDASRFPGADGPQNSGILGMNQSIWSVMSYVRGWDGAPVDEAIGGQGSLAAFDIAALQVLYGPNNASFASNDIHDLVAANDLGTGWYCIWDAGGNDTISAAGSFNGAVIDLRAATLREGDPNAGGFVSQVAGVSGGYTIANGVVIENGAGSIAADVLIGNDAGNLLAGEAGDDILIGGLGRDALKGGAGRDTFVFNLKVTRKTMKENLDKLDFKSGQDVLHFDNDVFRKLGKGSDAQPKKLKKAFLKLAAKAEDKNDYLVYAKKKGALFFNGDGSGSQAPVQIATFKKNADLSHLDIFVI